MSNLSRRQFAQIGGLGLAAGNLMQAQAPRGKITAGEVVERIQKNQGVPWIDTSFRDTFKVGGPDMAVTGICSTFGSNFNLLQRALKAGLNMVITHEPTFWTDADVIARVQDDPLYRFKLDWIKRNNMVVWRNHDNLHRMTDSMFSAGMARVLGWTSYKADRGGYVIPPTTLNALANYIAKRMQLRSVRVIGDPNLPVSKISSGRGMTFAEGTDCKIANDIREWDTFEYARDAIYSGRKVGVIVISHEASEDPGMEEYALWLKPFIPEVPVQYIPTTCEFWSV
jgi:putative NIF3 family GTP cyclohydrolase 1 type 2